MPSTDLQLVNSHSLPYLLSLPATPPGQAKPLLCFLHGYDEGAPLPIRDALTRHGPLRSGSAVRARAEFIVVAPQLPARGDLWHRHADAVQEIVREVQQAHGVDLERTYLTGFSFGGNGVFDLGLEQSELWRALWPVDPTRVPRHKPQQPVWVSGGEASRYREGGFRSMLGIGTGLSSDTDHCIYLDEGRNHVDTATFAYADDRIYHWLLSHGQPA